MDNIEDIYYNKYLKYKYKYLELKGKGFFFKSQEEKDEEKLYGPELLEEIKNDISIANNNIKKPAFLQWMITNTTYERNYDLSSLSNSLITTLEHMENVAKLTTFSTDIKNIINENLNILDYELRKKSYTELNININKVFDRYKHLSTFPILKKLFDLYYKTIRLHYNIKI